jgi:hypothetical protein
MGTKPRFSNPIKLTTAMHGSLEATTASCSRSPNGGAGEQYRDGVRIPAVCGCRSSRSKASKRFESAILEISLGADPGKGQGQNGSKWPSGGLERLA